MNADKTQIISGYYIVYIGFPNEKYDGVNLSFHYIDINHL